MVKSSAPPSKKPGPDLLRALLRDVSRSFYRTLQILPGPVRRPIGLGYLLARATDTIADTELVPVATRLAALDQLRKRIAGQHPDALDFRDLIAPTAADSSGPDAERRLLERIEEGIQVLGELAPDDRAAVREVLDIITSGQILDLQRFGNATAEHLAALATADELHDYTYRVAGCVGGFWTRICRRNLFPNATIDDAALLADGLSFGQGLQLVNILRDLPKDLRMGRCYLPADALAQIGLRPADLLDPANEPRLRPLYRHWLGVAEANLVAGWRYTNRLPFTQWRLRLGCAWPVLIGWQTLGRLKETNVLDATQRVKISRREVRQILTRTLVRLPFRKAWERLGPTSR